MIKTLYFIEVQKTENTAGGIRHATHATPLSIRKSWH
jgi:hypothetical protein